MELLHSRGIAHRDIKLENLLLDSNLNLILADFGCAARYHTENIKGPEFDSTVIVGSQEYNAPEINMDKAYWGDKADLFSCAVCLFMMVIGNSPFRMASKCDPYFRLLSKKDKAEYWAVYSAVAISPEFKDLFEKMTERNPEKRISLANARNHPWMKDKTLHSFDLMEELKDRLQLFEKFYRVELERYKRQVEECKVKHEWEVLQKCPQDAFKDPVIQGFITECQEINAFLEKHEIPDEKLSDDQVNSQHEEDADEDKEVKDRLDAEIAEEFALDSNKR